MERFSKLLHDPILYGVFVAFFGGLVAGIESSRDGFTWCNFFFRLFSAGFVGMVVGLLLKHIDQPIYIETAIIGISGYCAVDVLPAFKGAMRHAIKEFKKRMSK